DPLARSTSPSSPGRPVGSGSEPTLEPIPATLCDCPQGSHPVGDKSTLEHKRPEGADGPHAGRGEGALGGQLQLLGVQLLGVPEQKPPGDREPELEPRAARL